MTPTFPLTWVPFLADVDDVQDVQQTERLSAALTAASWSKPSMLVLADPSEVIADLASSTLTGPDKAFIRRAIRVANKRQEQMDAAGTVQASQVLATIPASQPLSATQPELLGSLQALLGTETSALQVAEAIAGGLEKPSVSEVMKKAKMELVTDAFCPDTEVYTALSADTSLARKKDLQAFTYIELTNSHMLPDYLPPESVGGKTAMAGQEEGLSAYTGNLTQMAAAFRALTHAPRCFRNIRQWHTAFIRYSVAAMACEQFDFQFVIVYSLPCVNGGVRYNRHLIRRNNSEGVGKTCSKRRKVRSFAGGLREVYPNAGVSKISLEDCGKSHRLDGHARP